MQRCRIPGCNGANAMDTPRWMTWLRISFPNLRDEGFDVIEPPSERYNCIAYAADDPSRWWAHIPGRYWPSWATRSARIESLREVFVGLKFKECHDGRSEPGSQKVALFADDDEYTHAHVQMPSGLWRSKMGQGPVIEHRSAESLSGGPYGDVHCFMHRPQLQGE